MIIILIKDLLESVVFDCEVMFVIIGGVWSGGSLNFFGWLILGGKCLIDYLSGFVIKVVLGVGVWLGLSKYGK